MIPGMYPAFERENKESELEKKTKPKFMKNVSRSLFYFFAFSAIPFATYALVAQEECSWNPKKWDKIGEQRKQQELIQQQSSYRKQFHELDKNKDYVIDSTEFIYRK